MIPSRWPGSALTRPKARWSLGCGRCSGDVCVAPPVVNREQGKGDPCPNLLPRKIVFMSQSRKDPLKLSHLLRRKARDKPVKKKKKKS